MFYSIDYFAMTIPVRAPFGEFNHETMLFVIKAFLSFLEFSGEHYEKPASWIIEGAKHPYNARLRHSSTDVCLSTGSVNSHIYVEFAGKACNTYEAAGLLDGIILKSAERASRIDFAVDVETNCDPRDYILNRHNESFVSSGEKRTPSGRTSYLGGRTSERMARVYRYEPPHPRSHLLRVEAEYKGKAAKAIAKHYLEFGIVQACLDAHKPFGWSHGSWDVGNKTANKLPYKSYRPENASTVKWLYGDVITALSKAIKAGLVDEDDWLAKLHEKGI